MGLENILENKINEYALMHGDANQPNFAFCSIAIFKILKKELNLNGELFAVKGCFIIACEKQFEYFLRGEKFRVGNLF